MVNLSSITAEIGEAGASLNEFISDNKSTLYTVGAGVGGAIIGAGTVALINQVSSKKSGTKRKTRSSRTRKGRSRDRKFISKQKHERAYQRRRRKAGKKTYGKRYKTRKPRRLIKGSKEAKAYMAKLRRMRK